MDMKLIELLAENCMNSKHKEVAEKLIALAKIVGDTPFRVCVFEKASLKIIQKFIQDDSGRLRMDSFRIFILEELKLDIVLARVCRSLETFNLKLLAEDKEAFDQAWLFSRKAYLDCRKKLVQEGN